jgi:hypothetical protein
MPRCLGPRPAPGAWLPAAKSRHDTLGVKVVGPLSDNAFVSVSVDRIRRVARVTRNAERPRSIEQITQAFDEAARAFDGFDRARLRLLIDLRAAPGRNDPEFEQAMATRRQELMRGFPAVAILVQTPVGELQIARISREDGSSAKVFNDEAKAIAWLTAT